MPTAAAAGGASKAQIQLFFTVVPVGQPVKNVSVRAAYTDIAADVVRGAAAEALGGEGEEEQARRLAAFWHGAMIDLEPGAKTVEQMGWHTGFGIKAYELPARGHGESEGGDADWARVSAAVNFWPPVERVVESVGAGTGRGLVLREVSGDAAIKLVQEAARGRVAAAAGDEPM